jgi:16S rRNA (adenine1518-N6/adenine1519-N6)-dimethyltransferase
MEVRAKKALGQHFLTDQRIAQAIVDALEIPGQAGNDGQSLDESNVMAGSTGHLMDVLEVGPGMGVLTQYLLQREDIDLKLVEIDGESVEYLLTHIPGMQGRLLQADFLTLRLEKIFPERFAVIGNFPYNISSQIFFKILDYRDRIPEVVCMIQKEVAERIAEGPGSKTYGILSVLLQAWYDIEYLFSVGSGCFAPPPKVESAVIRLTRNTRTALGCDESLFKAVVKTAFGQRRKMMRNPLKPLIAAKAAREGWTDDEKAAFTANPVFERRPETLSVEEFIALTNLLA